MLSLVIGAAGSGQSRLAQPLAASARRPLYFATATVEDEEMAARVERHRADRDSYLATPEDRFAMAAALERHTAGHDFGLPDCLTISFSNFAWEHRTCLKQQDHSGALAETGRFAAVSSTTYVVVVTNEFGFGLVPESHVDRSFRDRQSRVNQEAARRADSVYLVVAGTVLVKRPEAS